MTGQTSASSGSPAGILRRPLTAIQLELLETVWWPAGHPEYTGQPAVWPVWDYVARTLHARHPDLDDAVAVLMSLPVLELVTPLKSYPYGLVWRHSHPRCHRPPSTRSGSASRGWRR